jgi:hypothetical protein
MKLAVKHEAANDAEKLMKQNAVLSEAGRSAS